ncbi:DUF4890 domain-containing protein [Dysgonomonas sp. OttesenSCG-928-M03]|nr:DUF4890 domain-containing protein [Dysgonomonas sp. OttesenSCG-928-M03]
MKTKLLSLLILLFVITGGLSAQRRQQASPEMRAKRQTETLAEKLSLSEEQKQKVYDLNLKYANQAESTRSNDGQDRRAQFRKQQEQKDAELKTILTDEQQKQYEDFKKENPEQRRRR